MLDVALKFLVRELNGYLLVRTGGSLGEVQLGPLVDDLGKWAFKDRLCAALVNVEEERTLKSHLPEATWVNGTHVVLEPALKLNLHVLFAASFTHYDQSLHYLSHVLTFFQSHPGFSQDRYPDLDPRIQKLTAELLSLGYEQLNQLWAFIGGKQLPSAVYKVRLVALQDPAPVTLQPPVLTIDTELHPR
jgi:Pvc16 N-terminal domain